jgi:hypothetical protein
MTIDLAVNFITLRAIFLTSAIQAYLMDYLDYELEIDKDLKIRCFFRGEPAANGKLELNESDRLDIEFAITQLENEKAKINRNDIRNVGTKLANALFTPDIKKHFYNTKKQALSEGKGLRIRLRSESPEISMYPWETLYQDGKFLSVIEETPLSRFIKIDSRESLGQSRKFHKPVKILIVGASPSSVGLTGVQINREMKVIQEALAEYLTNGSVIIEPEPIGEITNIMSHLNKNQYNIIHFIGHGVFKDGIGYLALEDKNGGLDLADHERIGQIFINQKSLALIILNACQGAVTSKSDNFDISSYKAFGGIAPELIRVAGVPAVVAMKYSITNQFGHLFSNLFYQNVISKPVDEIVQIVRHNILVDLSTEGREFTAPVLFMQSVDGIIFTPANDGAKVLALRPEFEVKIKELRKAIEELITASEAVSNRTVWLMTWDTYKAYKKDLQSYPEVLQTIERMISTIPVLIREQEEADMKGLTQSAMSFDQTIKMNYQKLVSVLP